MKNLQLVFCSTIALDYSQCVLWLWLQLFICLSVVLSRFSLVSFFCYGHTHKKKHIRNDFLLEVSYFFSWKHRLTHSKGIITSEHYADGQKDMMEWNRPWSHWPSFSTISIADKPFSPIFSCSSTYVCSWPYWHKGGQSTSIEKAIHSKQAVSWWYLWKTHTNGYLWLILVLHTPGMENFPHLWIQNWVLLLHGNIFLVLITIN